MATEYGLVYRFQVRGFMTSNVLGSVVSWSDRYTTQDFEDVRAREPVRATI
jgi:hypothetical protein